MLALARRAAPAALRCARGIGGAPKLSDSMVAITAVTPEGRRYPVFGRVGSSLAEALAGSSFPEVSGATVVLSPRYGSEAHVRVAHEFASRLPPLDEGARDELDDVADDVAPDSRLASKVTLTPELNSMVVAMAPLRPSQTL